ncbi:Xaa-His dipeptidase [Sulfurospirillum sp. 1307]
MSSVREYFELIASTPRCSFKTEKMRNKIVELAKKIGYKVEIDKAGNVLCSSGKPKVCLQSHYDMVCVGDVNPIELIEKDGLLRAKNSSLGADNGMGMAIMFSMMEKYDDLECLFTNDEEVGLIGASNLEFQIQSDKLLNLDGEEEKDIYVGCAGGIDVVSKLKLEYETTNSDEKTYEVSISGLDGGHSGVDIDKNIPNAIKLLAGELVKHEVKLVFIEGGEFRNSIPKSAKAIVTCKEELHVDESFSIKEIDSAEKYIKNGNLILKSLHAFASGIRAYDKEFMIPLVSVNLGVIRIEDESLKIDCSCRAMKDTDLITLAGEIESFFSLIGCETKQSDIYLPWIPNVGDFANIVKNNMNKIYKDANFKAIHAGLECGILIATQKKEIEAVSIGPTIRFPHSLREECDMNSVDRIASVVENILKEL